MTPNRDFAVIAHSDIMSDETAVFAHVFVKHDGTSKCESDAKPRGFFARRCLKFGSGLCLF